MPSPPVQGVACYDTPAPTSKIQTFNPAAVVENTLNTAVLPYGPASTDKNQYEGITLYPPPSSLGKQHPPLTYLRYLQRVLYKLETITFSRSSQCASDTNG